MGKVLVLYDSASGNTAKMAALVAAGAADIPGTEVRARPVAEATPEDVYWCDGIAVGSPTNMGLLSWKMKRFWDEAMLPHWMQVDGKIACAFSSSGGWGGGTELACQSLLTVLLCEPQARRGALVAALAVAVARRHTARSMRRRPSWQRSTSCSAGSSSALTTCTVWSRGGRRCW